MKRENRLMLLDTSVLKDEEVFLKFYEKMPRERKNKIDALKPEGSKRLCLGAGILLDRAVREYLSADGSKQLPALVDYEIVTGPQGKPYIKGLSDFSFNLSHSGDMAVIAVSDREVGVDIQKLKHFKDSLVDHVFNIEDSELVKELMAELTDTGLEAGAAQHGDSSFDQIYTRMWAMKESVMKYTGKGLSLEPKKILLRPMYRKDVSPFIHEYTCLQDPSAFYGISVCSEYKDFGCTPEWISL